MRQPEKTTLSTPAHAPSPGSGPPPTYATGGDHSPMYLGDVSITQRQRTAVEKAADDLAHSVGGREQDEHRLLPGPGTGINVTFAHRPGPDHHAAGAASRGGWKGISGYFRRLRPGRLVITGAPGAGKTLNAGASNGSQGRGRRSPAAASRSWGR